ncbi:hypothetical protein P4132_32020 [Pseudomonas aeruginosa]|nr:hypothetical protein [Pseudomonas aeruginosa]
MRRFNRERQFPEGFKRKIVADLQEGIPQFDVLQYFGNQPDIFERTTTWYGWRPTRRANGSSASWARDFVRGSTLPLPVDGDGGRPLPPHRKACSSGSTSSSCARSASATAGFCRR